MEKGSLIVVSGFSGAGKGTLMKELLREYDNYVLSVSMTTRDPRPGEEHGREYFFVTMEEFGRTVEEDGLLEYATYVGNRYGTPRAYVEEQLERGKDVLLEIEVQGGMQIRQKFPEAILLFVVTPSAEELKNRLSMRKTETEEQIRKRLERAREETAYIRDYDFVIVNDDVARCAKEMDEIIRSAKRMPERSERFITEMEKGLNDLIG